MALWLLGFGLSAASASAATEGASAATEPKVRVLLQLVLSVDGKPLDAIASLRVFSAPLKGHEAVRRVVPATVTPESADSQGWATLEFAPGNHFLIVLPPGMEQVPPTAAYHAPSARFGRLVHHDPEAARAATWLAPLGSYVFSGAAPDHFETIGGFLLQVPADTASTYAGTLSVRCAGGAGPQRDQLLACSEVSVSDHHSEAPALPPAAEGAPPAVPVSLIVSRYGTALLALDPRGDGRLATEVGELSRVLASEVTATPSTIPFYVIGTSPAGAIFNLAMLAGKAITDAQRTRLAAEQNAKWQACLEQMAAEGSTVGLEDSVRKGADRALDEGVESARSRGPVPASGNGPDFHLSTELEPKLLQIAACGEEGAFCLEMAMRVTLRDLRLQRLVFDAVFIRAGAAASGDPLQGAIRLAQLRADDRPAAATQEVWCGNDRAARFRSEVEAASESIVRSALRRAMGQ